MTKPITWVGIDDDKKSLTVAVLRDGEATEPEIRRIPNEDQVLRRWVRQLVRGAEGGEVRLCYEAGPNGFALRRRLESLGPVQVEVIAPSLTPRRPGKHVKTDPLDARKLMLLYRAGELTPIAVPSETDEAARDVVRIFHRLAEDRTRKRHQIQRFLVRRGRIWREGKNWTEPYRRWAASQEWGTWTDALVFDELWTGLRELEDRRKRLQDTLERLAGEARWQPAVAVLRCFYGVDTDAALTLVTEIFDVKRFGHPRQLMSYLGITPTVRQSGDKERRGGISKAGNRDVRWMLGQIAWHYRRRPQVGVALQKRREGQPAWAIALADRAHHRLHRRYWALVHKGKSPNKAVTAAARELVGFVWEALLEVSRREERLCQQVA
jgi:transposase